MSILSLMLLETAIFVFYCVFCILLYYKYDTFWRRFIAIKFKFDRTFSFQKKFFVSTM